MPWHRHIYDFSTLEVNRYMYVHTAHCYIHALSNVGDKLMLHTSYIHVHVYIPTIYLFNCDVFPGVLAVSEG